MLVLNLQINFFTKIYIETILNQSQIKLTIAESFGIRCPVSIQTKTNDVFEVYDYEDECEWSNMPLNETAFCGKCSRMNQNTFFNNVSSSLSFKYVIKKLKLTEYN